MIKSPRAWFALSLLWIAAVGYFGWTTWPQIPLDVSSTDPSTLDVYGAVSLNHAVFYSLLALLGPMILFVMLRMAQRQRKD